MMLRRLHPTQPDTFAFTPDNQAWAEAQMTKFPAGRQASAVIPLLWRAQEQEGWLSRPAIEHVADMLEMAHIRALEVATFYFMFQLQPVGSVAHIQVCGTTSCMICGAEDLMAVCKEKIAERPHEISQDGKLSWEEVECLGACANAPMAQIGKDYYEDLTAERFGEIIDELRAGRVPTPGPQNGRYASEPAAGLTTLSEYEETGHTSQNVSVALASDLGDTVKRIDGSEVPLLTPWLGDAAKSGATRSGAAPKARTTKTTADKPASRPVKATSASEASQGTSRTKAAKPVAATEGAVASGAEKPKRSATKAEGASNTKPAKPLKSKDQQEEPTAAEVAQFKPAGLSAPRDGTADDLKMIEGIGPKLEGLLNDNGIYHFDQIAGWSAQELYWADYGLAKFKGRASRDDWVEQAKILASGQETEFSKRAEY